MLSTGKATHSVEIRKIRKSFGELEVIHGVSIDISGGEFVVLVGPSGCGKSTLLRIIAGLEASTSGEIEIGGRNVTRQPPKDRDIAMVFQNYALYPNMTVGQNMAFALQMRREDKALIEERVKRSAEILGLSSLLDRYPRQLSGGQRQRVAMGRAIVRDPKVFLFDEPLSNLDAKLRVQMRAEIKELHQRLRTTIVYVTHDQIEAMTMADKIVVMRDGHVEQIGKPLDLYDRPANQFVAGFIGSPAMNFLTGVVGSKSGPGITMQSGDILPLSKASSLEAGRSVVYGIRPEHFDLVDPNVSKALLAQVVVVEPTGAETMLVVKVGGVDVTVVFRDRHALLPGQVIGLRPRLDKVHLFDENGTRILHSDQA